MAEPFDWNDLRVEHPDYGVLVAPCMAFTMWFDRTDASGLLDFYERVMEALGPELIFYQADSMKYPAKTTPRARTLLPTWIKKPAECKFYFARFQSTDDMGGAAIEVHFEYWPRLTPAQQERYRQNLPQLVAKGLTTRSGLSTSTFRVTVPLDHPLAEPARFARWALDFQAAKSGEFVTGGCDYSLNCMSSRGDLAEVPAKALCMRHPGLDYWHLGIHQWFLRYEPATRELLPQVKRAGWITLVNERALEYLGGEAKLAETVAHDPAVRLLPLTHGLALQSGDAPRLGDASRLDFPYRSAAAAIRPVRIEHVDSGVLEDQWMKEWLGMLDRPLPEARR